MELNLADRMATNDDKIKIAARSTGHRQKMAATPAT
jgi:hypothetical protein